MFIVLLEYIRPLEEIDALIPLHRAYLQRHYASGHFLMSGRREPRTGGVILASVPSRTQLEQILQEDPFHQAGVVRYEVLEFVPTMTHKGLEAWQQA
ncbi:YciI family protein [Pseudaeromonas sharmana]|uniref:YciI family protein n=1 Tax=Pseudaeromonas sharmana TaxID=328412 RepID=A0ABV8CJ38_9GAMM